MTSGDKEVAMRVVTHHTVEQLQYLQRKANRPSMVLKFWAIALSRKGWIAPGIADALGKSTRTIQQWASDYNIQGLEGLRDRRGGNHSYLNAQQEQQLKNWLDAAAEDPNDGLRHVAELVPWIEEHFGVTYSLSGLYDLLYRLGYEWLVPHILDTSRTAQWRLRLLKIRRFACGTSRRRTPCPSGRGVVPRRSPLRSAGYADPQMGPLWLTTTGGEARRLSCPGRCRW